MFRAPCFLQNNRTYKTADSFSIASSFDSRMNLKLKNAASIASPNLLESDLRAADAVIIASYRRGRYESNISPQGRANSRNGSRQGASSQGNSRIGTPTTAADMKKISETDLGTFESIGDDDLDVDNNVSELNNNEPKESLSLYFEKMQKPTYIRVQKQKILLNSRSRSRVSTSGLIHQDSNNSEDTDSRPASGGAKTWGRIRTSIAIASIFDPEKTLKQFQVIINISVFKPKSKFDLIPISS